MKKLMKALLCTAAALSLSAYGSAGNSSSSSTDQTTADTADKTDTKTLSRDIQKAFTDQGYTITKGGRTGDGYEFDATNDNGPIEVSIGFYADQETARKEFDEETFGDDFTADQSFTNEAGTLSIFKDADDSETDIEVLSATHNLTISVEGVQTAALDNVLKALAILGYQTA